MSRTRVRKHPLRPANLTPPPSLPLRTQPSLGWGKMNLTPSAFKGLGRCGALEKPLASRAGKPDPRAQQRMGRADGRRRLNAWRRGEARPGRARGGLAWPHNAGVDDCLTCQLSSGQADLPGGLLHRTDHWLVEHCVGPLGLGTLVVKPERHVVRVADLTDAEAAELGPLLRLASWVAGRLVEADQVYNCLWSHAGGRPAHIHYVVQPVTKAQMERHGAYGPRLQVAMGATDDKPARDDIERIAALARQLFSRLDAAETSVGGRDSAPEGRETEHG